MWHVPAQLTQISREAAQTLANPGVRTRCVVTSGDLHSPTGARPHPGGLASPFGLGRGASLQLPEKGRKPRGVVLALWAPAAVPRLRGETEAADLEREGRRSSSCLPKGNRKLLGPEVAPGEGTLKCLPTARGSRNSNPEIRTTGASTKYLALSIYAQGFGELVPLERLRPSPSSKAAPTSPTREATSCACDPKNNHPARLRLGLDSLSAKPRSPRLPVVGRALRRHGDL